MPRARAAVTYSLPSSSYIRARTVWTANAVADQPRMTIGSQARERKSTTRSKDQGASLNSLEKRPVSVSPNMTVESSMMISASRKLGIASPR